MAKAAAQKHPGKRVLMIACTGRTEDPPKREKPEANGDNQSFYLYTYSKDSIVWVDALQMEAGETPTEFTLE